MTTPAEKKALAELQIEMDRASAMRKRTSAKSWVTKFKERLEAHLAVSPLDKLLVETSLKKLEDKIDQVYILQEEIESYLKTDQEVREESQVVTEFLIDGEKVVHRAKQTLLDLDKTARDADVKKKTPKVDARLPKLSMPKFSGELMEWESFWDQFEAMVHSQDLPDVTKLAYLQSLLQGEPKEVIHGLALSGTNYQTARELLIGRYGKRNTSTYRHIQELLNIATSNLAGTRTESLRHLQDSLRIHIRGLENLGISQDKYGILLTPIVLSCLPTEMKILWSRQMKDKDADLEQLMTFLDQEIEFKESSSALKFAAVGVKAEEKKTTYRKPIMRPAAPTASALFARSGESSECDICQGEHVTKACNDLKVPWIQRKLILAEHDLCWKCVRKGHKSYDCPLLQGKDSKPREQRPQRKPEKKSTATAHIANVASGERRSDVIMQTMEVMIMGRQGRTKATVFFDSGSNRSFITTRLAKKISPEFVKTEFVCTYAFGAEVPQSEDWRKLKSFEMQGLDGSRHTSKAVAIEVPKICTPLHRSKVPTDILESLNVKLSDNYDRDTDLEVDILIGLDQYWLFMKHRTISITEKLVAQETLFGWMLSGAYGAGEGETAGRREAVQLFCVSSVLDNDLKRLWDLDLEAEKVDTEVLDRFCQSIKVRGDRYEVELPWKEGAREKLVNNYRTADIRLRSLSRKMDKQPELKEKYDQALLEMEKLGIIVEVPAEEMETKNPVFYMPHRPVVKESSVSTKVRPVFDASAKDLNGLSLNDCVETGPNLLPSLVEILIRFRRWKIALAADIQKAFLQIAVVKEDQDVHRFLWNDQNRIRVMRFDRVPFGNRCSPFILNATIRNHLKKYDNDKVVMELEQNLYVDDWLTGADDEDEAAQMIQEADHIMKKASMNLTKWGSNSREVLDKALYELSDKCEHLCNVKVLGLRWSPEEDCFMFEGVTLDTSLVITKRIILSLIARLFDPLGFLNPFVIGLKCLFQELWRSGIEWDSEVPDVVADQVIQWIEDLQKLKSWRVNRRYSENGWRDIQKLELHAFGDASEVAYGACIYLVVETQVGLRSSSLVISKTRVAPLKKVTLPRLELMGAVLAVNLLEIVRKTLGLEKECCTCYTDSMVVLGWVKENPVKWKPFVANRVGEIQNLISPSQWTHIPGEENPADLVTRGVSAEDMMSSVKWLQGPVRIVEASPLQTLGEVCEVPVEELRTQKKTAVAVALSLGEQRMAELFDVRRWGTLIKAIRVIAWVNRFIRNIETRKEQRIYGELTLEEMSGAKVTLIKYVQEQSFPEEIRDLKTKGQVSRRSSICKLSPYVEGGLVRVRGRLGKSEQMTYEEKHPIILPKGHLSVLIMRYQHRLMKHSGVNAMLTALRGEYWMINGRRTAKTVTRGCIACQKMDALQQMSPVADLHETRVQQMDPFAVIGLDYAGPLYCADLEGKSYILLITCAVTRAVHLEVTESLSLKDFVLAFRRFAARRGIPSQIWSDNAKTFIAGKQKLVQMYGTLAPDWNFIVPRSPWWGGWWERLVRSTKSGLKKTVGKGVLTRTELETLLHEVEACINSRPLGFVGDEVDDPTPLTPAHFLIGRTCFMQRARAPKKKSSVEELQEALVRKDAVLQEFWNHWRKDYIRSLPQCRGKMIYSNLQRGDLVLIREDNCTRLCWPVGVIEEAFTGGDGISRSFRIRTKNGVYTRPVQRLYLLEMHEDRSPHLPKEELCCRQQHNSRVQHGAGKPKSSKTCGGNRVLQKDVLDNVGGKEPEVLDPNDVWTDDPTQGENRRPRTSRYGRVLRQVDRLDY